MRAVMLAAPEDLLSERRRRGLDRWDEVWEGVLHMVPPPSGDHQRLGSRLLVALAAVAEHRGLVLSYETGLYRPGGGERDYRVPDLVACRPELTTAAGVEGAVELVVEILSPDDETYDKLPFYESLGVREVMVIEPKTRAVELHVLRGGKLRVMTADATGALRSESLGLSARVVQGPKLRMEWGDGSSEV